MQGEFLVMPWILVPRHLPCEKSKVYRDEKHPTACARVRQFGVAYCCLSGIRPCLAQSSVLALVGSFPFSFSFWRFFVQQSLPCCSGLPVWRSDGAYYMRAVSRLPQEGFSRGRWRGWWCFVMSGFWTPAGSLSLPTNQTGIFCGPN